MSSSVSAAEALDALSFSGFRDPATAAAATAAEDTSDPAVPKQALTVTDVDWSIDVVLATDTMQQPAANGVPIVNLSLTLSDGSVFQRRLTTAELHKWRYTLARATKDLAVIASRAPQPEKVKKSKLAQ
jgi:hypothetical protein